MREKRLCAEGRVLYRGPLPRFPFYEAFGQGSYGKDGGRACGSGPFAKEGLQDERRQKIRLDRLLVELGFVESRSRAQALIMAGKVMVDGEVVDKAGRPVEPTSRITLREGLPYVSRGGLKLEGFFVETGIDVRGLVVMDVGSSTGGFTDCLLKRGAKRVIAVDVGKGLLDWRLRNDKRVRLLEGRNIRYLKVEDVGERVDMAVIDVSFISLEKVLPVVRGIVKEWGGVLCLVKPQFEVGKGMVGKGGVVNDPDKHRKVIERLKEFSKTLGFTILDVRESVIRGAKGNREFWLYLRR